MNHTSNFVRASDLKGKVEASIVDAMTTYNTKEIKGRMRASSLSQPI